MLILQEATNVAATSLSMSAATTSFDSRYFINAHRPRRGTATLGSRVGCVPLFLAAAHVCVQRESVCVCVCGRVTSIRRGRGAGGFMVCSRRELLDGDHLKSDNARAEVSKTEECREAGERRAQGGVNLAAKRSTLLSANGVGGGDI